MVLTFKVMSNDQISKIKQQQADTLSVVKDETIRLGLKKANMDAEATNADRMILLNQTFRDRQRAYLVIMVLFLIIFGICLAIVFLQTKLGYSSTIMDLLLVLVIGSGAVSAFFMISNIFSRDVHDFNKLGQSGGNLIDLSKQATKSDKATAVANAVTAPPPKECVGAECCPVESTTSEWNPYDLKCQKKK